MNRNRQLFSILGVLIVVLGILLWIRNSDNPDESEQAYREFAIEDGDQLSRIFMVDQQGNYIDLKKKDEGWIVNDTFDAWQSHVDFLIDETLTKVAVKSTVPKSARDNVLRRMIIAGVKVELYTNGDVPARTYYVGGTTPDQLGTYFKHPEDNDPFIVHIPGFNGYLNVRYSLDKDDWVSRNVFSSDREDISRIIVNYPTQPIHSFTIENGETIDVEMDQSVVGELNKGLLKTYLSSFTKLNFEGYDDSRSQDYIDSIKQTDPLIQMTVETVNKGSRTLTVYPKPMDGRTGTLVDKDGNALAEDADRYYAFIDDGNRLLLIQDYTFGKVFLRAKDFVLP